MDLIGNSISRLFGERRTIRQYLEADFNRDALRDAGFSLEEADQMSYIYNHRQRGRYIGAGVGAVVAYTMTPWVNILGRTFPVFHFSKPLRLFLRLGTAYATYLWVEWVFTFRREGPNNYLLNAVQWTNLKYSRMRDTFCQHFEVLNRPFTPEEKIQFAENQVNRSNGYLRKFTYNPYLHGVSEEEFTQQVVERFVNNIAPWERRDVQQQIALQNQEKIEKGHVIRVKPFDVLEHFDKTGIKYGIKRLVLFHNQQILG